MTLKRLISISLIVPFLLATHPQSAPAFKEMEPNRRKIEFIRFLTPHVNDLNQEIKADRARILALYAQYRKDKKLSVEDEAWLRDLALTHKLSNFSVSRLQSFDELLDRRDEIPLSLAIAQAATESGWGTSTIALTGHNYFGHMCFTRGCGIQGVKANQKRSVAAKKFDSPAHSIQAYFDNVNSHPAYKPLWKIRAQLRNKAKPVDGASLADGLVRYSELGPRYVHYIKKMIRSHGLEKVDAKTA